MCLKFVPISVYNLPYVFFFARMEFLENIGGMEMSSCGNVLTVAAGRKVFFLDAHT